jgi:hypothetical protein
MNETRQASVMAWGSLSILVTRKLKSCRTLHQKVGKIQRNRFKSLVRKSAMSLSRYYCFAPFQWYFRDLSRVKNYH